MFPALKHPVLHRCGKAVRRQHVERAGLGGRRGICGYVASKHAIIGLNQNRRASEQDLARWCQCLIPGPMLEDMTFKAREKVFEAATSPCRDCSVGSPPGNTRKT